MELEQFYKDKKVLVTGNSGFKGSWMTAVLLSLGCNTVGYSLPPLKDECLFHILRLDQKINTQYADIRNYDELYRFIRQEKPEIIFHLAAQPLVQESYLHPRETYETNVMGTVNVMESVRQVETVRSFVNITTDKVYKNNEWIWGYRENEILDGYDPYSNSKSCAELVTETYKRSFDIDSRVAISTVRAGNVIGGGDFAKDRIIPDCFKAARSGVKIRVRNPNSIRPYQHVLEAIFAYLEIAWRQYNDTEIGSSYNIGPDNGGTLSTLDITQLFCEYWGNGQGYEMSKEQGNHEASVLRLDCTKIEKMIGWRSKWTATDAVKKTVEWYKRYLENAAESVTHEQIREYYEMIKHLMFLR